MRKSVLIFLALIAATTLLAQDTPSRTAGGVVLPSPDYRAATFTVW